VSASGTLERLASVVARVSVPGDELAVLSGDTEELAGAVVGRRGDDSTVVLVAAYARGQGEIVVISDPRIFSNRQIARADNAVLAYQLLVPNKLLVVFDEFYHGLSVRGNPLYLLTRPGFAAATVSIVLIAGLWSWRHAVFLGPPLADRSVARRDIAEYVNAMGAFFSRGQGHRRFVLRELREGTLHRLADELHLPPDTTDASIIIAALARRNPLRAESLAKCLAEMDSQLESTGEKAAARFLDLSQRLSEVASPQVIDRLRTDREKYVRLSKPLSTFASSNL
jgi:hypothetical protein